MVTLVVPEDQQYATRSAPLPSFVTPKAPLQPQISPKSHSKLILHQNYCRAIGGRMKFTKKKLILLLLFILCSASIFRFLNINMIITNSSASLWSSVLPPIHQHQCSSTPPICRKNISHPQAPSAGKSPPSAGKSTTDANNSLTEKEMQFLLKFFSRSVPCNLLIFGLEHQYSSITSLNAGGLTIFLEDHLQKTRSTIKSANNTQVHGIKYNTVASGAYQLLKDARENPYCSPKFYKLQKCNLVLTNLPQEVYDTMWDVLIVDGPSGDTPDSPGSMASIYTASVLARRGNKTHVIVHDVDRMIEKWFSWEFLCEENLVSSKGRFCLQATYARGIQIVFANKFQLIT